ncbi:MAG: phosphonate ABC transporter ATP-binding protein [Myxococcota bacterium]
MDVVRLENVTVRFRKRAVLHSVSLAVSRGERVVLVGPSGAGKSTLLGVLNGTVTPDDGEVFIMGKNVRRVSARERRSLFARVGTVYQDLCLIDNLRVVHNVNAGHLARWTTLKSLLSLVWPQDRSRAFGALSQVGIAEKMYETTGTLSGGQRQRVAIARILVQDPTIVLADEPIASLDPERSTETMDLLRQLNREFGKTMLVSCHSPQFVKSHFDRVVGVKGGRICLDRETRSLSSEDLTTLYLSSDSAALPTATPEAGLATQVLQ